MVTKPERTESVYYLNAHRYTRIFLQYLTVEYIEFKVVKKDKAIPLQALTGPGGSGSLRFPDFKTVGT
jgi:hypothetical protein